MKKRNIRNILKKVGVLGLAVVVTIAGNGSLVLDVSAGSSDIVIDATSFQEELDATVWNNPSAELTVKDGKIIFPEDSTGETRLLTANPIKVSEYHDEFLSAEYTLKLKTLPKGEKFIVAFGLTTVESYYGEAGNLELTFENNSGLKASLIFCEEDGEEKQLVASQSVGSLGQNINVQVSVTADMKASIRVNGKTLYDKK